MRRLVLAAPLLVLLGVLVLAVGAIGLTGVFAQAAANQPACGAPAGTNRDVAMTALVVGTRLQASERVLLAAAEAGLVESGMRALANDGVRGPEDHPGVTADDLAEAALSLALPHDGVGSDSDSVGPLQQRRSWGTAAQRLDPTYAFTQFYLRAIPLDQAGLPGSAGSLAQRVQVSRYPGRYDQRQADAVALLASLAGGMPVGCAPGAAGGPVAPVPAGYGTPGPCGLSPSTDYARYLITRTFGVTNIGGCAPGRGHVANSYHYPDAAGQAHALDVMVGADRALGDRVASWAVANAKPLNLVQVLWYGRIFEPGRGWRPCGSPTSSCGALHFDHPHLSFRRGT